MSSRPPYLALLAACILLPAACTRPPPHRAAATTAATHHVQTSPHLPDNTGIPICDDYLSSYIACHRAAGIFPADQLQGRYEMMRESLLRDSQNPQIRPQLANRCNMLASQLRDALHGRSCNTAAGSTP